MQIKFNEYFTSIGSTLASKIPQIDGNHLEFIKNYISNVIFLNPTNEHEIKRIINDLVSTKSPGYDDISPKVIKAVIDTIYLPLYDIFNKSLQTGCFPETLVNNYRPISVLPMFSNIVEKIIFTRISNFVVQKISSPIISLDSDITCQHIWLY